MIIENMVANTRAIGKITLIPGANVVNDKLFESTMKAGFKKPFETLVDSGVLKVEKSEKLTVALIQKTYSVPQLQEYLEVAPKRGPIKAAITKQLKLITDDLEKAKEEMSEGM